MKSTPVPFGPRNLWPERLRRSTASASTSRGSRPCAGARLLLGEGDTPQRRVDRLRAAAGEDDVRRAAAQDGGDSLTGVVDGLLGLAGERVGGGGVAEALDQVGEHRFQRLRVKLCRRSVVEVDHVRGAEPRVTLRRYARIWPP